MLEDGRLAKQTPGSFRRVAAGKVAGLQALERQLAARPVPGLAAFSSVSSIVAPLGQSNYAAANASLCAWGSAKAAQGRNPNPPVKWSYRRAEKLCGVRNLPNLS